jgi:UDP-glucose 4-epimerase
MPYVAQVAVGRRAKLQVFGHDYATADGTGVRDYIHVMDLVAGHVLALEQLLARPQLMTLNLGTGRGVSVLQLVSAFERASQVAIPFEFAPRRPGDSAENWADPAAAEAALGWRAQLDLDAMCRDTWNWQQQNPRGFAG